MSEPINTPIQRILFGSPGTGKSHRIHYEIIKDELKILESQNIISTVFHPEYTYGDFMGKLVPITKGNNVRYQFHAGHFLRALTQAYNNIIKDYNNICFADTDIPIKDYQNPEREGEEQKRVGNYARQVDRQKENKYGNKWIYRTLSNISYPQKESSLLGWNQLLCIEFNPLPGTLVYSNPNSKYNDAYKRDRSRREVLRRFPCPDLVLKNDLEKKIELHIVDYKDVPIDFYYKNFKLPLDKSDNKYRNDIIKQLTYELVLQQTHKVLTNRFFIPYYYKNLADLGKFESDLNIKGIKVFKANFPLIQEIYLNEKL